MTGTTRLESPLTVGQVAERFGVTVRTLHHYDEVGLLSPSERSTAGYRLYTGQDVTRLQHVVVYRRLGFALEEIALLLEHPETVESHLRRQRAAVMSRLDEMRDLVTAIDRALEREIIQQPATTEDMKELFGDGFYENQTDALHAAFVAAMDAGEPPTSEAAMDAAEQHRLHIDRRFYDCTHAFHTGLADMYVSDSRFTATYDEIRPGMSFYVRDAIYANAERAAAQGPPQG